MRRAWIIAATFLILGCESGPKAEPAADGAEPEAAAALAPAEEPAAAQGDEAAPTLDGRTFVVGFVDPATGKPEDDTLTFADGIFNSKSCEEWGFSATEYAATAGGSKINFEAETTSEKEGTMLWKGAVDGDKISGTAVWTKEGQKPIEYVFETKAAE